MPALADQDTSKINKTKRDAHYKYRYFMDILSQKLLITADFLTFREFFNLNSWLQI